MLEALFALCRKAVENEPLKIFMALSDVDRDRATPLAAATVDRLAREYHDYGAQYPIFSESRSLSDESILQFLDTAEALNQIRDPAVRAPTPPGRSRRWSACGRSWCARAPSRRPRPTRRSPPLSAPFAQLRNNRELFDAGRGGVQHAAGRRCRRPPSQPQERMMDLLAGAPLRGRLRKRASRWCRRSSASSMRSA